MSNKFLIVDDSARDRLLLQKAFQAKGFTDLIFAETGEDGIQKAKESLPDVAIVDTQLPKTDGFQVCKAIKESTGNKTKVIILTGIIETVDATKARESGADNYCVKTYNWNNLIKGLKEIGYE